ncbi:hypothetical protein PSDI105340_11870 [Pseudoalteromonas distincta]
MKGMQKIDFKHQGKMNIHTYKYNNLYVLDGFITTNKSIS